MATLEEVYEKLLADDGEKKELAEALAATKEGVAAFLAQRGCEATVDEFVAFLRGKVPESGELGEAELEAAAGGSGLDFLTSISGLGFVCIGYLIASAVKRTYSDEEPTVDSVLCEYY